MTNSATVYYTPALPNFSIKDPISSLTHFIGFCLAIIGMPLMLVHASSATLSEGGQISLSIFMMSMILLYGASTAYHTFSLGDRGIKTLKTIDHMMIFVLIAGTYTPVCSMVLGGMSGAKLLIAIWAVAILGMAFKVCWVTCPKWISSVIYIGMGWIALLVINPIYQAMGPTGFAFLLGGGIAYTIGGVIYAMKIKITENFGGHEIFHIFVMIGSLCHFLMFYTFIH